MTKKIKDRLSLVCSRCNHVWNYSGNSNYFATCSYCRKLVRIGHNKPVEEIALSSTVTN